MVRNVRSLLLLLLPIALTPIPALACMYGPPFDTVCEKYARADAVVVATVKSVGSNPDGTQRVVLDVRRDYKKKLSGEVVLHHPLSTCDWDFSGREQSRLLLYLARTKETGRYSAIGTGYGGSVERSQDDLSWLDKLPDSLRRNRLSGQISLYNSSPFNFIKALAGVQVRVTSGKNTFDLATDSNGLFEIWDVPNGNYRIVPRFGIEHVLNVQVEKGDIRWDNSVPGKDPNGFEVVIGALKCGGCDFVVNEQRDGTNP